MNLQENIIRIKEVMGIYTSDQNIIVEASKKEILIDKLGFSNENAEVLANAAGPFSVWLGNKLINDGAFEYSKEYLNKVGIMNHVLSKITSIMDWIRVGLNGNAKPYQNMFFEQLYELSKEWHDSLKFGEGDFNYKEKNKILQDYRDENGIGFYWVDLGTNSSDEECNRMGHCGETALGNSLYSLRSTQRFTKDFTLNKSYLTVAVGEKDGLIYQLSADMIAANSPRKIILLNAWCLEESSNNSDELKKSNKTNKTSKKKIQVYVNALNEIENIYQNQVLPSLYRNDKTINLTTNVFYLLKDSYTIINGISNMKTEKTMALIEILDHTRLLSPGELAKQGK